MNDKSELLSQLKIDRSAAPARPGGSPAKYLVAGVVVALMGLGGGYYMTTADEVTEDTSAAPSTASSTANDIASSSAVADAKPAPRAVPASDSILNASGYITARRMATVSAEVMGLITDVAVEEGMTVTEGQVLAKLDDTIPSVDLRLAEAQVHVLDARLEGAMANLAEAKRVLKRASELKTNDFSSEASVSRAQAEVDSLGASITGIRADIEVAQLGAQRQRERLADHTIRAPFDGVVTVKNAQPGEIVSPSSAGGGFTRTGICTIVDMTSLEIEVDVNEAYIGRVFQGQKVEAQLDAYPDWKIPASVIAIIPTADRAKATVRVRISIDTEDTRILPDMGVKVAFMKA